jgi:hypothetical protein
VARVLVVDQPIERANARGEPVSPAFPRISIRREGASGATSETHEIGIIGGVVDGVAVGAARTRGPSSRYETVWRGDALVFLTSRHGPDGPQTGDWSARRESWSLDSAGRLQVEIVSEAHDRPSQTSVWLYRREEQPKAGS